MPGGFNSLVGRFGAAAKAAWAMPNMRSAMIGAGIGAGYGFATDRPMLGTALSWGMAGGIGRQAWRHFNSPGAKMMWNFHSKGGLMSAASKSGALFFRQSLAQGASSARHLASQFTKPIIKV